MILHAENGFGLVPHAFNCLIIEIDSIDGDVIWKRFGIDGKAVILGGNLHSAACQIFHRLVPSAVAEFQLKCFAAESLTENLMAQADPENWNVVFDQVRNGFDRITERRRISRSGGEANSCRFALKRVFGGSRRRHNADLEPMLAQSP